MDVKAKYVITNDVFKITNFLFNYEMVVVLDVAESRMTFQTSQLLLVFALCIWEPSQLFIYINNILKYKNVLPFEWLKQGDCSKCKSW